jgi:hypothetical protein
MFESYLVNSSSDSPLTPLDKYRRQLIASGLIHPETRAIRPRRAGPMYLHSAAVCVGDVLPRQFYQPVTNLPQWADVEIVSVRVIDPERPYAGFLFTGKRLDTGEAVTFQLGTLTTYIVVRLGDGKLEVGK